MATLLTINTATHPPRPLCLPAMDRPQPGRTRPTTTLNPRDLHLCRPNIGSPFRPIRRLSRHRTPRQHPRTTRLITPPVVTILHMIPTVVVRLRTRRHRLRLRPKHRILPFPIFLMARIMRHRAINTSTTLPSLQTRRRPRALLPTCSLQNPLDSSDIPPMRRFRLDPWRTSQRSQCFGTMSTAGLCPVPVITSV